MSGRGYENGPWRWQERVDVGRSLRDTLGATVLLSAALSAGMTAADQLSHGAVQDGIRVAYEIPTGDTTDQNTVTSHAQFDANDIASYPLEAPLRQVAPSGVPASLLETGSPLYTVAMEADELERELHDQQDRASLATPEALTQLLQATGEPGTVTEVTVHREQTMLDSSQRAELLQLANAHDIYSLGDLEAAYRTTPANFSAGERAEIERLLVDNPNIPVTLTLHEDGIDYRVALYDYNAGDQPNGNNDYAIAIETDVTQGHLAGSIDLLPLFVPIIRRRNGWGLGPRGRRPLPDTIYQGPSQTLHYEPYDTSRLFDTDYLRPETHDHQSIWEQMSERTTARQAQREAEAAARAAAAEGPIRNEAAFGPTEQGDVGSGTGAPAAETPSAPEEQPDADIIPFPTARPAVTPEEAGHPSTHVRHLEAVPESAATADETDEPTESPEPPAGPTYELAPEEVRRRLELRHLWPAIPLVLLAAVTLRGCETGSAPVPLPSPSASASATPSASSPATKATPSATASAAPAPMGTSGPAPSELPTDATPLPNPVQASIDVTRYQDGVESDHEALGTLPYLTLIPRLTRSTIPVVPPEWQPLPSLKGSGETPPTDANWTVAPGMGGDALMEQNGLPASTWDRIAPSLLHDFPGEFYVMPDGHIGLSQAGVLPPAVVATLTQLIAQ